jgi:hypothetical protein
MSIDVNILNDFEHFVKKSAQIYNAQPEAQNPEISQPQLPPTTAKVLPTPAAIPVNRTLPEMSIERKVTTPNIGALPPREAAIQNTTTGNQQATPPTSSKGLTGIKGVKK